MAKPGSRTGGSIYWACINKGGWLGLRNTVSGKFLGHNGDGFLRCTVYLHKRWERFCVRQQPEGAYILYVTHWDDLWAVGLREEVVRVKQGERARKGVKKLAKIGGGEAMVWEFVKV